MITWKDNQTGHVGKLIRVYIAARIDGLFDVTIEMIGGSARRLCEGTIYDAHEIAEQLCANEMPSAHV